MTRSWRSLIAASGASALALVALAACGQRSSAPVSPQPSSSQPTNSAGVFTLGGVEPDDGRAPLLNFIGGAQESIDVVIYQFDDARIRQALIDAHNRGVAVRVLMSWQLYLKKDEYADPSSRNYNRNTPTFNELRSAGIDVAWSRHQFPYTHQKSVVSDAGTDHGRAFIADYNFAPTYFDDGPSPFEKNEGGARGFAVTSSDQGVVNEMTRVFNADWPPFSNGEPYTDPHLVWSPTTPQFAGEPPGTSGVALPELIDQASTTLNVYMYLADPNDPQLNQLIAAAQRGVKVRFVANCGALTKSDLKRVQTAGIKVVYQPASASDANRFLFIHTKTLIADFGTAQQVGYVGSVNIYLKASLARLRELGALARDTNVLAPINATFERDYANSRTKCPANTAAGRADILSPGKTS